MHGAAPDEARLDAAEAAAHLAASAHLISTSDPEVAAFFTAFTRYASPEDLIHYTGAELTALVKTVYRNIKTRAPGSSLVEVFDPATEDGTFARAETIVLAVNDDSPFLYDSATAEIRARGYRVSAAFHPVVDLTRDIVGALSSGGRLLRESVIVLALEGVLDAAEMDSVHDGLLDVFASVRIVVRDWKPMLQRLADTAASLSRNPPPISEDELDENIAFLDWMAENHFTFLGCRDYVFSPDGDGRLDPVYESGLGLLADPELRVVRRGSDRSSLTPDVREFLTQPAPLIIAKSATRSPP